MLSAGISRFPSTGTQLPYDRVQVSNIHQLSRFTTHVLLYQPHYSCLLFLFCHCTGKGDALRTKSVERATVNLHVHVNKTEIFSYKRDTPSFSRNLQHPSHWCLITTCSSKEFCIKGFYFIFKTVENARVCNASCFYQAWWQGTLSLFG